ncbi:MAG: N-acetyl-gamma-glutamyl-phosphate reductase [Rhodospirillaceae bacterium]|nr:N-acetyl-gamma-glutamyl-phosphate reductase [Rhodospirillaceae bacterium]|tara:strand:+ start:6377 stop:7327 length:951 start_codon:yes stop_codon:yes gene_type:complete
MTYKIFIDGEEGTTGLQIKERLESRSELSLIHLEDAQRKDTEARRQALIEADVAILCLPDDAAREAVSLVEGEKTRLIDASTAHRTAEDWIYGFPEMSAEQKQLIANASRVTNPGCYPTGAIALLQPLISAEIIPAEYPITINAVSGYSGGGKPLIARMENDDSQDAILSEYFVYGLGLEHKHVPEILLYSGLVNRPIFVPSVGKFSQGMIVQIPLHLWSLPGMPSVDQILGALKDYYEDQLFVSVADTDETSSRLALFDPEELNSTNKLRLFGFGNSEQGHLVLAAQLDNLGKGASGQAVQNLNLMLGLPENEGL